MYGVAMVLCAFHHLKKNHNRNIYRLHGHDALSPLYISIEYNYYTVKGVRFKLCAYMGKISVPLKAQLKYYSTLYIMGTYTNRYLM